MIFDVEADGLLEEATKLHVLAYSYGDGLIHHTHDYNEMRKVLTSAKQLIGHNIICYDIPLIEKILDIKVTKNVIDTLPLSWYLNHSRIRHGLDTYGAEFGIPKPKIDDWENLTPEEYANRCIEDVKINISLWKQLKNKLEHLYVTNYSRIISYLNFKMDCLREQERSKWKLDLELVKETLGTLYQLQEDKLVQLTEAMPNVKKYVMKSKPAKPFKKDGTYSVTGAKWFKLLKDSGLPKDYTGEVKVFHSEVEANPNSHQQVKDWLFSLGWVPQTFDYSRNEDGTEKKVPQVRVVGDSGKELCQSVKKLIDKNPSVDLLEGLSVIQHRIAIFEGFLKNEKEGWVVAGAAGLTNTLRFKHRVLVNLPGVDKEWGEEIRGSLVAPDGYELCGSDACSLEETTKKHYMFPYDPEFVEEMSREGFDAHLDLAKYAGEVKQEEIDAYVGKVKGAKNLKPIRKNYKAANYACTYGVKKVTLSRSTGLSQSKAQGLIDTYWKRNWALLEVIKNTKIKHVGDEMWLYNPVSRFWYSLRNEKDIFSTLNQGTGVFCFDSWVRNIRKKRPQLTGQFHDEVILCIKKGHREQCKKLLKDSMKKVNEQLKLNVRLDVDVEFGDTYADVH